MEIVKDRANELEFFLETSRIYSDGGKIADYIPALAESNPAHFAASILTLNGEEYTAGDSQIAFTFQSISKVIALLFALERFGKDRVFSIVSMESTGQSFNFISDRDVLQTLNPLVNAGALTIADMIMDVYKEKGISEFLSFTQQLASNSSLEIDHYILMSEKRTAFKNWAIAYLLQDQKIIKNTEKALNQYLSQCSIRGTVKDIARIGAVIANNGIDPINQNRLIQSENAQIVKALMLTSGMYNGSGEFTIKIGLPAKSGVSGSIMACVPKRMGIGIYSPPLDAKGNSVAGIHLLETLSREWELSILK